jgi:sulfite exporter TauE/SafE
MVTTSLFATLFLSTLVSGWHCALMCGGIAAAIERPRGSEIALVSKSALFYQQLIMHLGRLTTYVLLGASAGQIGVIVWQQNVLPIQRPLFALSALILIAIAIRLWRQQQPKPSSTWLGLKAAKLWSKYIGSLASGPARWFSGMLWGLVPCGLVYSVLPLAFLSGMSVNELVQAITIQEPGTLTRVPGIGKKTAERLLLELKGKLAPDLGLGQNKSSKPDIVSEITQALLALGYSDKEAHLAVRQVPADITVSDGIKLALKSLSKG